jgi:hypothetical protein
MKHPLYLFKDVVQENSKISPEVTEAARDHMRGRWQRT